MRIKGFTPAQQQEYDAFVQAIIEGGIEEDRAGEMALINLGHIPGDIIDVDTEEGRAAWRLLTGGESPGAE